MVIIFWTQTVSYDRYNPLDSIVVYDMGTGTELISDGEALREAVSYDENCIYIKEAIFLELIRDSTVLNENICIYCGGYYKLPRIGGGGWWLRISRNSRFRKRHFENRICKAKGYF